MSRCTSRTRSGRKGDCSTTGMGIVPVFSEGFLRSEQSKKRNQRRPSHQTPNSSPVQPPLDSSAEAEHRVVSSGNSENVEDGSPSDLVVRPSCGIVLNLQGDTPTNTVEQCVLMFLTDVLDKGGQCTVCEPERNGASFSASPTYFSPDFSHLLRLQKTIPPTKNNTTCVIQASQNCRWTRRALRLPLLPNSVHQRIKLVS